MITVSGLNKMKAMKERIEILKMENFQNPIEHGFVDSTVGFTMDIKRK